MDPLSFAVLSTQIISLVQKSSSIANAIRGIAYTLDDPKFISTQADLFTEQSRLALWHQYIYGQYGGWEAITEHMMEEQVRKLSQFAKTATYLLQRAESLFARADPSNKLGVKRIKASIIWGTSGQEDLRALLNAIHKINDALEKVITPPPGYHGSLNRQTSPGDYDILQNQPRPVPDHPPETGLKAGVDDSITDQRAFHITQHLYRYSLAALEKIETYAGGKVNGFLSAKLKRWGDLLDGPLALDILLSLKTNGELVYEDLRQVIITILIDIILTEGCILTELVKDRSRLDLEQTLLNTIACLAVSDAANIAASRSTSISDYADVNELLARGKAELECAIDDLYQFLPTIRMIRRGKLLELEQESLQTSETSTEDENETQKLLDTVLNITSSSNESPSQGKTVSIESAVSRLVQKEIELIRDYKLSQVTKLDNEDRHIANELLRKFIRGHEKSMSKSIIVEGTTAGVISSKEGIAKLKERMAELVNNLPLPHTPSA